MSPLWHMKVFVRQDAEDDLGRIYSWISKDNPSAAADMVARIRDRLAFSSSTVLHNGTKSEPRSRSSRSSMGAQDR